MSGNKQTPKKSVRKGTKGKSKENKFSPLQDMEDSPSSRDADGDVQMHQSEGAATGPERRREKHRQGYSLKQRATTTRIRKCGDKDYYGVLGLERTCDGRDVRQAYRALALLTHPDHNKYDDAEIAFKKVGQAYQVLSNPQERAAFDRQHDRYENKGRIDPHDLYGEEFTDNASGDESSEGYPADEEDEPKIPDHAVVEVYSEATIYVNEYLAAKDTRPENESLIKIDLLTGVRDEYHKAAELVQDGAASGPQSETLRRIESQFENARKGYGYPETWKLPSAIGNGDGSNNGGPGETNHERRILGYVPHVDSQRTVFIVESQPNGIAMKRSQDIGSILEGAFIDRDGVPLCFSSPATKKVVNTSDCFDRCMGHALTGVILRNFTNPVLLKPATVPTFSWGLDGRLRIPESIVRSDRGSADGRRV
ncbi:DnaJ homolog subfamily B member 12 [Aspergillus awamori]|uniref:DnaJ homolog subfamily B member 12 n=1 Tax=Aspergillus awamori TaxID=105351 RepID=A0A401L2X6_ASPAW|nr:DnaJ homolog subfamily B member 12 [Aspergillus awamori]